MALNTSKCSRLTPLRSKGLTQQCSVWRQVKRTSG